MFKYNLQDSTCVVTPGLVPGSFFSRFRQIAAMSDAQQMETQVRNLIRDGQLREAAAVCDQLNQQFPDHESSWYATSQLALLIKEPELGVRAIDQALMLSPGKPEWLLQRIECLGAMGDRAGAIEIARQMSPHRLTDPLLSSQFGYTLSKLGLFELALPHYQNACNLRPNDSRHYYNLATVQRCLGDIDGAYPFSYDLIELANYFVAYRQLTHHWLEIMPCIMHVVRYEELVCEPRPTIENLLDYCDLSFEEECVRFYDSDSSSTDASVMQARKAFSRASIGNWRNYEKQLQPVAEILASAGLLAE